MPDERETSPLHGTVGFRGVLAQIPPVTWRTQHDLALVGGYQTVNRRRYEREYPFQVPCMPVRVLYRLLLDQVNTTRAERMGYTVDA